MLAKIEAGRMSLTIETVDLRELMADILETTSAQATDPYTLNWMQCGDNFVILGDECAYARLC
jgi:hypothetical protein